MSKARDLANSAAAFSAVSATELGYVDGVTSAIQTQLDAKAASSTAVTLTGTQTLTNKTLTSPALTTPTISTLTTNGDVLYGTGSGALSRLGIGSSAQILTVASGIPSWATPAASGALTLISTTTITAMTQTISSIPGGYKHLQIVFKNFRSPTDSIYPRFNSDTGSNYYYGGLMRTTLSTDPYSSNAASTAGVLFYEAGAAVVNGGNAVINVYNYTDTDIIFYDWTSTCSNGAYARQSHFFVGAYDCSAAITSFGWYSPSGGSPTGTVYIYGVN